MSSKTFKLLLDDRQVTKMHAEKVHDDEPRLVVEMTWKGDERNG